MSSIVAFAVVDRDGTLLHSDNVEKVDHVSSGEYDIYFSVPTTVQVVSFADSQLVNALSIAAYGGVVGPNVVRVQLTGLDGVGVEDHSFQIICVA